MVHRREVDGEAIVLGNHGALWGNAMTWFDHETGSVWSQPLGLAVAGPLRGTTLELLPSTLTEWGDWRATHPDSLAMDAPSQESGFDLETMSIVVEIGNDSMAVPVPSLRQTSVANIVVDDAPVAVVIEEGSDNWVVFSRQLSDRVVELREENGRLVEVDGPGQWDLVLGLPEDADDETLAHLPGFTAFQNDYETFFPLGRFWQPDGPPIPVN